MKEARHLSALKEAIAVFAPIMTKFQQENRAYKFQIAVCVVFHKAVDPSVVTQPPVTLTSEMVAVHSDASPPLEDVYRQLLNFIEIYEHNGSGWVFSNFASLQLTHWHLDPLRASAFVPLPRWIRKKKAVVNITGTGGDYFKLAVLAGMHPVGRLENSHRMSTYERHVSKYPKDPRCRFTNVQKQLPAPFVVYADFESILKPENEDVDVTQDVDTSIESSSHTFQEYPKPVGSCL